MADSDSPTNHLSTIDNESQVLSEEKQKERNQVQEHEQESTTNNDWSW